MAKHNVVDEVLVVWTRLIGRAPSSTNYLKLPILNQLGQLILHLFILPGVPHLQILHLSICKSSLGVIAKFFDYRREDRGNRGMLGSLIGARKILIKGLFKAKLCLSKRNQMYSQCLIFVFSVFQLLFFCMPWVQTLLLHLFSILGEWLVVLVDVFVRLLSLLNQQRWINVVHRFFFGFGISCL